MGSLIAKHLVHKPKLRILQMFEARARIRFRRRIGIKSSLIPDRISPVQQRSRGAESECRGATEEDLPTDVAAGHNRPGVGESLPLDVFPALLV